MRDARLPIKRTTFTIWDNVVKGLGVQITPRKKSYILRYTVGGRKRQAILGRCSEISLRKAREMAGAELANIRSGQLDPLERKLEAKLAPTVNEMLDRFFGEFVPSRIDANRMCERTEMEYLKQSRFVRSKIGGRKIERIGRREIEMLVEGIVAPTMRNRTLSFPEFSLLLKHGNIGNRVPIPAEA